MDRSRFIYSQNSLLVFLAASVLIHTAIFAGVRINLEQPVNPRAERYTVSLRLAPPAPPIPVPVPEAAAEVAPAPAAEPVIAPAPAPAAISAGEPADAPATEPAAAESQAEPPPVILGSFGAVSLGAAAAEESSVPAVNGYGSAGNAEFVSYDSLAVPGVRVPKPNYPDLARRWGHEGTVVLELIIAEDGTVKDSRILKSSGYDELDDAAVKVVLKRWRFEKQEREVRTRKEFEFRLNRE